MSEATPIPAPPDGEPDLPPPPELGAPTDEDPPDVQKVIRYARFDELYLEYKFWANPRTTTGLSDPEIDELAQSILAGTTSTVAADGEDGNAKVYAGVRVPLEVVKVTSNGGFISLIIDGQRRYRGVERAALPPDTLIPVYDLEHDPVDWTRELADQYLLRALDAVGTRAGLSSFELSEQAQRLRSSRDPETAKDYTLAKISAAIHRSESWVSKILAARAAATPKLLLAWKLGEVTDEQFKDLATVKDRVQQRANADAVVEARRQGDKTSARTTAKEQRELAKPARSAAPAKPAPKDAPKNKGAAAPTSGKVVRGPQTEMPIPPPRKPPSYAVIEDFLGLAKKRLPVHDYVKGLMDGARWATGNMDAALFARPWQAYMNHVQGGSAKPAKTGDARKAKRKAKPAKKRR